MRLLRRGKVKDVYELDDDTLEFHFSDRVSVFDVIIPNDIPHKGETLCRTSAYWFKVARELGIRNHFIGLSSGNKMKVQRLQILKRADRNSRNCVIPLEFIARHYIAGSLYDRIKNGELDPKALGLGQGTELYGKKLPEPFIEVTTKFEKFDRGLNLEEALEISGLTKDEYRGIEEIILQIDERIGSSVKRRGLIHVDGKKEFGLDDERNFMVVDTFGTTDEDRFWDLKQYEEGSCIELSKEFVRQYYKKIKYYDELTAARKKGLKEPAIPPLPENMVAEVDDLYVTMYERITGEKFR